mgnify:CR=1 FL=1
MSIDYSHIKKRGSEVLEKKTPNYKLLYRLNVFSGVLFLIAAVLNFFTAINESRFTNWAIFICYFFAGVCMSISGYQNFIKYKSNK